MQATGFACTIFLQVLAHHADSVIYQHRDVMAFGFQWSTSILTTIALPRYSADSGGHRYRVLLLLPGMAF